MKKLTLDAKETLVSKTGASNDFLGWIDLPIDYDKEEFARIKAAAKKIRVLIPTFCWLSVSVVLIWEQSGYRVLKPTASTMYWIRCMRRTPESTSVVTPSAPPI